MVGKFKLPRWLLPVILAMPMLAGANGGGSKNVGTSAAREAFNAGNYELMYSELESLKRNLGPDTLRLKYADALLLQSQAAEAKGDTLASFEFLKRYLTLSNSVEDSHYRFSFGLFVILIALLALVFNIISSREVILRKNESLSKLLAETTAYRENESKEKNDIPEPTPPDIQDMDPEQLYIFLSKAITSKKLFLNPAFGRQTLMDDYSLSKEKIGRAFSVYGTSLPQFINVCRLDYACSLMKKDHDISVSDVAAASGFTTRESFSRSFKQQYALSPSEYRENLDY